MPLPGGRPRRLCRRLTAGRFVRFVRRREPLRLEQPEVGAELSKRQDSNAHCPRVAEGTWIIAKAADAGKGNAHYARESRLRMQACVLNVTASVGTNHPPTLSNPSTTSKQKRRSYRHRWIPNALTCSQAMPVACGPLPVDGDERHRAAHREQDLQHVLRPHAPAVPVGLWDNPVYHEYAQSRAPLHRRADQLLHSLANDRVGRRRMMLMMLLMIRRRRRSAFETRLALVSDMVIFVAALEIVILERKVARELLGPLAPELLLVHQLMIQDSRSFAIRRPLPHSTAAAAAAVTMAAGHAVIVVVVSRVTGAPHTRVRIPGFRGCPPRPLHEGSQVHDLRQRLVEDPPAPPLQLQGRVNVRQVTARAVPPVWERAKHSPVGAKARVLRRCEGSAACHEARP